MSTRDCVLVGFLFNFYFFNLWFDDYNLNNGCFNWLFETMVLPIKIVWEFDPSGDITCLILMWLSKLMKFYHPILNKRMLYVYDWKPLFRSFFTLISNRCQLLSICLDRLLIKNLIKDVVWIIDYLWKKKESLELVNNYN